MHEEQKSNKISKIWQFVRPHQQVVFRDAGALFRAIKETAIQTKCLLLVIIFAGYQLIPDQRIIMVPQPKKSKSTSQQPKPEVNRTVSNNDTWQKVRPSVDQCFKIRMLSSDARRFVGNKLSVSSSDVKYDKIDMTIPTHCRILIDTPKGPQALYVKTAYTKGDQVIVMCKFDECSVSKPMF
jgi:hypothetical protein